MEEPENLTYQQLIRFCSYQERCTYEVLLKCRRLDLDHDQFANLIEKLKEHDYLNDERFARLYVSGKFRIKRWGKQKIKSKLIEKRVDRELIEKALNEVNEEDYLAALEALINMKTGGDIDSIPREKLFRYLAQRGYEYDIINSGLAEFNESKGTKNF